MNENLINDFLERSNDVKYIDEDAIQDATVQVLIPSNGIAIINVTPLWTVDQNERQSIVNDYWDNINIINHLIINLCNGPVEKKDVIIHDIMKDVPNHAKQLGLHDSWPNLSPDAEALVICLDLRSYLEGIVTFIADTFGVIPEGHNTVMDPETENPFNEEDNSSTTIPDDLMQDLFNQNSIEGLYGVAAKYAAKEEESDDEENSDENFANMLAAELSGATEGEEFTDNELYGHGSNE